MKNEDIKFGVVFGICRKFRWATYGCNHGHMIGWPHWIQNAIVTPWNVVVCAFKGHDKTELDISRDQDSGWPKNRIPCCVHCNKKLI